jgi:hypothetical protein
VCKVLTSNPSISKKKKRRRRKEKRMTERLTSQSVLFYALPKFLIIGMSAWSTTHDMWSAL